jgi:hypothetical protein
MDKQLSFIDDEEKMLDFFTITKREFLKYYSYLTEEEYDATLQDVLSRQGNSITQKCDIIDFKELIQG